jgi:hypothetical protein
MPWAIYTDLSGVTEISDGFHPTEQRALEVLILNLESEKSETANKLASAKQRLRRLRKIEGKKS